MRALPAAIFLLAAACTTIPEDETYVGGGSNPYWFITIRPGEIRLALRRVERHQVSPQQILYFPGVAPVQVGEKTVWTASASGRQIMIEAEFMPQSPCARGHGPDKLRLVLDGRELLGCGGQLVLVGAD